MSGSCGWAVIHPATELCPLPPCAGPCDCSVLPGSRGVRTRDPTAGAALLPRSRRFCCRGRARFYFFILFYIGRVPPHSTQPSATPPPFAPRSFQPEPLSSSMVSCHRFRGLVLYWIVITRPCVPRKTRRALGFAPGPVNLPCSLRRSAQLWLAEVGTFSCPPAALLPLGQPGLRCGTSTLREQRNAE